MVATTNTVSQIIKTILAIIGIVFGGLLILGGLIDRAAWPFLVGSAFLGPAVWWFVRAGTTPVEGRYPIGPTVVFRWSWHGPEH